MSVQVPGEFTSLCGNKSFHQLYTQMRLCCELRWALRGWLQPCVISPYWTAALTTTCSEIPTYTLSLWHGYAPHFPLPVPKRALMSPLEKEHPEDSAVCAGGDSCPQGFKGPTPSPVPPNCQTQGMCVCFLWGG